jgi:hypothetical protein
MLQVDEFLKSYNKEIVDFIEQRLEINGNIFDRIVNELATNISFG